MRVSGKSSWKKCADIGNSFVVSSNRGGSTSSKVVSSGASRTVGPSRRAELEDYFNFNRPDYDEELHVTPYANERCEMFCRLLSALMRAA